MFHRLAKTAVAALALAVAAAPAAARPASATPAGPSAAPAAAAETRQWTEVPKWLAWLQSIVTAEVLPPGDAPATTTEAGEGESDLGPSMDPDG